MQACGLVLCCVLLLCQSVYTVPSRGIAEAGCIVTEFDRVPDAIENCDNIILDNLYIPGGRTLRLHLRDGTTLAFRGNTTFGYGPDWEGPLVVINGTNVNIEGEEGSVLDGQGQLYWDGLGEWGTLKPKFFTIQLHNSVMKNIYVLNSPVHCVLLADSSNVELSEWVIDNASGDVSVAGSDKAGHNTDGFDIWNGTNVVLKNNIVHNQDDCVAIRCGTNILVDDMICYGGHGLSISVGFSIESVEQNTLRDVLVSNSILSGGENGIHIKTHVDGGVGLIQNVTYHNIQFEGPSNYGINIQENYRNLPHNSSQPTDPKNNIPIKDLTLENITGSVEPSAVPIYILCADEGCFDWIFTNVLVRGTKDNSCNYVPDNFSC